jgi:hypothetical protein
MLFNNYRSALDAYAPPLLDDRVVHYVSEEWQLSDQQRSLLGGLQIRVVPGFHQTMFEGASLEVLAAAIERDLAAADTSGRASGIGRLQEATKQRLGVLAALLTNVLGTGAVL